MPGFDPNKCRQVLEQAGLTPPCGADAFDYFIESQPMHAFCSHSMSYYTPVQWIGCYNSKTNAWRYDTTDRIITICQQLNQQDPAWNFKACYLCCTGPAMAVATGAGTAAMGTLGTGDQVLVGSLKNGKPAWSPAPLAFSQGVAAPEQWSPTVRVELGGGVDHRALIFSPDQVLLLADSTLTTADRLAPGQQLMGENGQPVRVAAAGAGPGAGSGHYLAASTDFGGRTDGHLLSVAGIVIGDYTLQLHLAELPAAAKASGYEALPRIGTSEYAQRYPQPASPGSAAAARAS
jgi:hypothetical protein